ncbi:beta-glucosidase family protein [Marinitoga litoralis]|uniref:beta-glucosidase family protein n=1 Tax=Marinitoga litoralis TaxID=570855 RepID=UPI0019619D3F|nr:beta-glucosidase [Marinitoga litoralis]MBM7559070.1 beta-glucosidase [Marinitoga litoralis]
MDIDQMIKDMTLDEKLDFIVGPGLPGQFGNDDVEVRGTVGIIRGVKGLPDIYLADGPAGLRIFPDRPNDENKYYATSFPIESMLASTWNREILKKVGEAMGEETKEYGVDVLLAPALNIQRNPLGGRNFEYYSEDPLVSGEMAASFVEGVQSKGVGTSIKHFVANNQETNRMKIDTIVSERALREIYLKGFEIALKANPWTVMTAYNKVNGYYCSQSEHLITKILREEWGFDGLVMSDWFAGDSGAHQVKAGNDLIMPGKSYQVLDYRIDEREEIKNGLEEGILTEKDIDEAVRNLLKLVIKTPKYNNYNYSNKPDLEKHAKIAYEAALEGIVLLKNNDVFPVKNQKVAVFGTAQIETIKGGLGSGDTHPKYVINIIDGFKEKGINFDEELYSIYKNKIEELRKEKYKPYHNDLGHTLYPRLPQDIIENISHYAENNDLAIIVISRISGEFFDINIKDFYLYEDEIKLLKEVSKEFKKRNKKVAVLLNIGSPIEMASWENLVDGTMLVWQAGQETGRAIADIVKGNHSPSGKLALTIAKKYEDLPSLPFPVDGEEVVYDEGIYVGYRYFDTFKKEPLYEFGYGLSYTNFEYSNLKIENDEEKLYISFDVKNIGNLPGKEIAQVYVRAPKGSIDKPFQELKGFEKTKLLNPGEVENIKISINIKDLSSYYCDGWRLDKGKYEIRVGASSRDIRLINKIIL